VGFGWWVFGGVSVVVVVVVVAVVVSSLAPRVSHFLTLWFPGSKSLM
jgi:hypothetical protein